MGLARKAKILNEDQEIAVRAVISRAGRHRQRNQVMFLLSHKAGLRAKEIASLTWSMATDAEMHIGTSIALENKASKGKRGGRSIPLNAELRAALTELLDTTRRNSCAEIIDPQRPIILSERGGPMLARSVVDWFGDLYRGAGLSGCSSHSGRRGFITRAGRKIALVGGSVRDVQLLVGHASLATTQGYIDADNEAQRRVVDLV